MDSHIQGPVDGGSSHGATISRRGFLVTKTTTTKELVTIDASPEKPVLVELRVAITEAFNATLTNVLTVGTEADTDLYLAAADVDETAVGVSASKSFLLTARTTLAAQYVQTGTAATTGKAYVIVELSGMGNGLGLQ